MTELEHNKQTVIAFITRAFNDKQPADAVAKYVGSQYIQHDPRSPDGAEAFIQFVNGIVGQFPQVSVAIKRVIAEGDLVVTHGLINRAPEDRGVAAVDIFRLHDGKIVEHWGVLQPVPEMTTNDNSMV
jgi:predicted SnoaL-like aldol condensation-catalyzing enzyme